MEMEMDNKLIELVGESSGVFIQMVPKDGGENVVFGPYIGTQIWRKSITAHGHGKFFEAEYIEEEESWIVQQQPYYERRFQYAIVGNCPYLKKGDE